MSVGLCVFLVGLVVMLVGIVGVVAKVIEDEYREAKLRERSDGDS